MGDDNNNPADDGDGDGELSEEELENAAGGRAQIRGTKDSLSIKSPSKGAMDFGSAGVAAGCGCSGMPQDPAGGDC
jgi:hypothetical protein